MSEAELIFTALAELSTRQIAETVAATGMAENQTAARTGGNIARRARLDLEAKTSLMNGFTANLNLLLIAKLDHLKSAASVVSSKYPGAPASALLVENYNRTRAMILTNNPELREIVPTDILLVSKMVVDGTKNEDLLHLCEELMAAIHTESPSLKNKTVSHRPFGY